MTKKVYILTEEGKGYSDKGLDYLTNHIVNNLKETADLDFVGGAIVNDATFLADQLNTHDDCYVIISDNGQIIVISKRNIAVLRDSLIANPSVNSWITAKNAKYFQ